MGTGYGVPVTAAADVVVDRVAEERRAEPAVLETTTRSGATEEVLVTVAKDADADAGDEGTTMVELEGTTTDEEGTTIDEEEGTTIGEEGTTMAEEDTNAALNEEEGRMIADEEVEETAGMVDDEGIDTADDAADAAPTTGDDEGIATADDVAGATATTEDDVRRTFEAEGIGYVSETTSALDMGSSGRKRTYGTRPPLRIQRCWSQD